MPVNEPKSEPLQTLDKYTDSLMTTLKLDGMTTRCNFCLAWNFADEKVHSAGGRRVTLCCKAGKICHLPTPPELTSATRLCICHLHIFAPAIDFTSC